MISLGQLKEIKDLREVWPHEALDFTPWLAEEKNLALLADAVGLEITVDETESKVGDFNVDIYAIETGTERRIIIENQLEDTNHDHLGKLITYASGKGADIVIWIVKRAREEHRAAIEWLNNHTDENISFFLIEIKLYKIGNSDPAVKFEMVMIADILYKISSGQCCMVAALPVIIPAAFKAFVRNRSNKVNRVSLRFQAQDNFGSPDIYSPRHAGDECNKSIVDGFANFLFQRSDHDRFGLV